MERVKWTENVKKCNFARKSRWNNNCGTDKEEEKKLGGSLAKKEMPAEGML